MSLLIELLREGPLAWSTSAALEQAQCDRPRLVFAGSALDHWSSAWAAALNADHVLAAALGEIFSCVAIDVAAEPKLAARIQHALQLTTGASGWPVMAVCTPTGEVFGALSWRPLHEVTRILLEAAEAWHRRPDDCAADAARIAAAWHAVHQPSSGRPLHVTHAELLLDAAEAAAMAIADPLAGGFGPAPRTAEPALWGFLVQRAGRDQAPLALVQQVERSLAALCAGAAHDHVAGGFFAGCSDAAWSAPQCAKGLADQALIADLLLTASDRLGNPLWRTVALRAMQFTCNALRGDDGQFAHGLHADSPAAPGRWEEGACYRWTIRDVAEVIGESGAALIGRRFALPAEEDAAGFLAVGEALTAAEQRRLPELVNRLAMARAERPQPRRDEVRYPVEQAQLAVVIERVAVSDPSFVDIADGLLPALMAHPSAWAGRALVARWRRTGQPQPWALTCAEAGAGSGAHAEERTDDFDPRGGLSTSAVLAQLYCDLADMTGDQQWLTRADQLVSVARDRLRSAPLACAGLLSVLDRRAR